MKAIPIAQKIKLARLLLSTSSFLMRVARRIDSKTRALIEEIDSIAQASS